MKKDPLPSNISLTVGQKVRNSETRISGNIVEGPNKAGKYLVQFGAMTVWLAREQLDLCISTKKKNKSPKKKQPAISNRTSTAPVVVDFHGLTAGEALEVLEKTLDNAIVNNVTEIEVIHGLGSGVLKRVVHQYLSEHQTKLGLEFALVAHNPGVTKVTL
jgi:DNA mismatch repair protein MutS2